MMAARAMDRGNSQGGKSPPIGERHIRIDERDLHQIVQRRFLGLRQLRTKIRDHHVPAGEHTVLGSGGVKPVHPRIDHLDSYRRIDKYAVADRNGKAAEANAYGVIRAVESAVVDARGDHVFHRAAGNRLRDKAAYEEPGDAGVAIREVEFVRAAIYVA